jgi:hypothetical protein
MGCRYKIITHSPTGKPEIKPPITAVALGFLISNYEPLTSLVLKQFQKSCGMEGTLNYRCTELLGELYVKDFLGFSL